jgi:hypothetical protein
MAKLVGRTPVDIKLTDLQQGYVPIYNTSSRAWDTTDLNALLSGTSSYADTASYAITASYVSGMVSGGGSGTPNKIVKFIDSSSIGDSQIIDLGGGGVGINKTTPNATLDINGNVIITGSLTVTQAITASNILVTNLVVQTRLH